MAENSDFYPGVDYEVLESMDAVAASPTRPSVEDVLSTLPEGNDPEQARAAYTAFCAYYDQFVTQQAAPAEEAPE